MLVPFFLNWGKKLERDTNPILPVFGFSLCISVGGMSFRTFGIELNGCHVCTSWRNELNGPIFTTLLLFM